MGKTGKIYLSIIFMIFVAFMVVVIQTFRPVRNVQPDEVMKISGVVTEVKEGSGFDIVITLKDDAHYYYINRGLTHNLNLEQLRSDIFNKSVTLYAIKRWTIFTRDKNMGHISKLMIDDQVIFNEIENDEHQKTIQ